MFHTTFSKCFLSLRMLSWSISVTKKINICKCFFSNCTGSFSIIYGRLLLLKQEGKRDFFSSVFLIQHLQSLKPFILTYTVRNRNTSLGRENLITRYWLFTFTTKPLDVTVVFQIQGFGIPGLSLTFPAQGLGDFGQASILTSLKWKYTCLWCHLRIKLDNVFKESV